MIGTSLRHCTVPSPNIDSRKDNVAPSILLLHYTGMPSAQAACDWLCNPQAKVSCHYLISETGEITQMVSEEARAWHAGAALWHGNSDINSQSVGIEIHNEGHNGSYPGFPVTQMWSVVALCKDIVLRHNILPENVLAHSDVAPGRKIDPGEKFDWKMLFQNGVGHWVPPVLVQDHVGIGKGAVSAEVAHLQTMLARYGYGVEVTSHYDERTRVVVEAFQRHFRPSKIDGLADYSTCSTLENLIAELELSSPYKV